MKRFFSRHLVLALGPLVVATTVHAQPSTGSGSLSALSSKGLLGDSANTKDFGKLPTNITSDSLTVNSKTRVFTYKGHVVVTQGDLILTSKTVDGSYSEDNQIQKVVARGDVVITKQDIKATSQLAAYDATSSIITLTDNPQLQQGESLLIADRIKVYLKEDRSEAEGNVRVTFVKKDGTALPNGAPSVQPTATPTQSTTSQVTPGTVASPMDSDGSSQPSTTSGYMAPGVATTPKPEKTPVAKSVSKPKSPTKPKPTVKTKTKTQRKSSKTGDPT
jgi:lipopolysaccharide export system protein LptA